MFQRLIRTKRLHNIHTTLVILCVFAFRMQSIDGGNLESSGMSGTQWHSLTAHLSHAHAAFFAHWVKLVDIEEAGNRCAWL
jgi:hypothetical protein